jgi:hypothetical protein
MRILAAILGGAMLLGGCAGVEPYADDATVAAVSYRNEGPHTLTLMTMLNNRSGSGAHTSLLISADERILFDPAGSFKAEGVPERNDVLFGISPRTEQIYISAHARSTHRVVTQTIEVSPQQAQMAYRLALANGPVAGAFCTNATSSLLRQIPGFEGLSVSFFPDRLMEQFGQLPGVTTVVHRENDDPSLEAALARLN